MIPGIVAGISVPAIPPGLWTPVNLPVPPKIWVDWDSDVTDVSGNASAWSNSKGSFGGSFTQSTAGFQPQILSAELNGRRVLRFDGTNDGLIGAQATFADLFRNVGYGLAFAVYKKRGTDGSGQNRVIFRAPWGVANRGVRFDLQCADPSAANALRLGVRRLDADAFAGLIGDASSGDWSIGCGEMQWTHGEGAVYQDGALTATNMSLTTAGATQNTAGAYDINIGFFTDITNGRERFADIDLAALLILSGSAVSGMDRQRIEGWLAWECGLQSNLPAAHPYRDDPPVVTPPPLVLTDFSLETTLSVPFVQGIEVSGDYAWVTSSGEATVLRKYALSDWSVIASATLNGLTPGFDPTSLGDPLLYDGVLYIPCGDYVDGGDAFVIEVDPDTLAYIAHHDLSADCDSGLNSIVRYDGKWYVGETAGNDPDAVPALRVFDDNWDYLDVAWTSASGLRIDFNGASLVESGPYMIAGGHRDSVYVFNLDSTPSLIDEIPTGLSDVQGVSCDDGQLYVSYRSSGQRIGRYEITVV